MITPSILNADFAHISDEIAKVEKQADWLHLDVMDGHFVPNLSFGPAMVEAVKRSSNLPLDVHLMIIEPEKWTSQYLKAGASNISFHFEACADSVALALEIRKSGATVGLAIKPGTSFEQISDILPNLHNRLWIDFVSIGIGQSGNRGCSE